jgi:glycosyltransferase involved in cell wall biosynthesis
MKTISYAITACNEHVELDRLLTQLSSCKRTIDEIIVQLDITATQEVKDVVSKHKLISYVYPLNNDFSTFKNNLKSLCSKDYIFQIDADEYLSDQLLENIAFIIENNDVDMYAVPRINTVEGLTQEHINKWGWRVNEKGWVNYPDPQTRIIKNKSEIRWENKVHERIVGYSTGAVLPEGYDLIHPKTITRQEKQNDFYNKI